MLWFAFSCFFCLAVFVSLVLVCLLVLFCAHVPCLVSLSTCLLVFLHVCLPSNALNLNGCSRPESRCDTAICFLGFIALCSPEKTKSRCLICGPPKGHYILGRAPFVLDAPRMNLNWLVRGSKTCWSFPCNCFRDRAASLQFQLARAFARPSLPERFGRAIIC